jgi:hypothetical protein
MPNPNKLVKFNGVEPNPAEPATYDIRRCEHNMVREQCHECFVQYELDYLVTCFINSNLAADNSSNSNKRLRTVSEHDEE